VLRSLPPPRRSLFLTSRRRCSSVSDLPWFPLYATDFLNSRKVRVMTPEQVGVYALLLCHQWDGGPLPDDDALLSNLCQGAPANTVRTVLEHCFNRVPEGWVNERLEEVRDEQESRIDAKRRAGVASGKSRRRKKMEHRSNTVPTQVEHRSNKNEQEEETREEEKRVEKHSASGGPRKPKKRATRLPDSWTPTDAHRDRARREGVNLDREAERFRLHADANARTAVEWNAAFTTWLMKAAEMTGGNGATQSDAFAPSPLMAEHNRRMMEQARAAGVLE